jgi:hypothetical protein
MAQEGALSAVALDEVDLCAGFVPEKDGEDETGKPGARSEVEPGAGTRSLFES